MSRLQSPPNSNGLPACQLPVGLARRGRLERNVVLRPLRGEQHLRLLALDPALPRERALSYALACCVERLGSIRDPSPEILHSLTLCDRHALVRALIVAAGGDVSISAECAGCKRRLELTLDLTAVHLPLAAARRITLNRRCRGRIKRRRIRLPGPTDLEAAEDETSLIAACMNCSRAEARTWRAAAERLLTQCDPLGHLEIVGQCLDCGHQVLAEYDLTGTWLRRMRLETEGLLHEIHVLASSYHWSEIEILQLPAARRRAYLDLCWETEPHPPAE